jgi:Fe-S cluster assembly iron-binding protein IscA
LEGSIRQEFDKIRSMHEMTVSERAAQKLKDDLIQRFFGAGIGFRVSFESHGPVRIELDRQSPCDVVAEFHGVRVLVDPPSTAVLKQYELDYVDGPRGGFCLKELEATDELSVTGNCAINSPVLRQRTE